MKSVIRYRTVKFVELLSYSILPIIFWVSIIFGFDTPCIAILTITCALIHECGHYFAIFCFTDTPGVLRGHSSGFRIKQRKMLSYGKEIAVLLAGPLINVVFFIICFLFGSCLSGYVRLFGYVNLATGISNLLPIEGYDGYGALSELFRSFGRDDLSQKLEAFSFIFSVCLIFLSLYLIDRFGEGYWIFGLFFVAVVSKLATFGKYNIFGR